MALIKCPECGKDISSIAIQCIYCGYPVWEMNHKKNNTSTSQNTDATKIKIEMSNTPCPICKAPVPHILTDNIKETCRICGHVFNQEFVDKNKHLLPPEPPKKEKNIHQPTCPRCGSTAITTGQRGYSLLTGFIGSKQTVNRCGNCGKTWYPTRWD